MFKERVTERGFPLVEFQDLYGKCCSIQKSSLATEDAIWFGISDPEPMSMIPVGQPGAHPWAPYPLPDHVSIATRMHLSKEQVQQLLPILQTFAKTGCLPHELARDVNTETKQ
jgi:hypothetical protein